MVTLSGILIVPTEKLEQTRDALAVHVALTRAEEGCLAFDVWPDENSREIFHVKEAFIDAAAFAYHQTRAASSDWGALTHGFQRDYELIGLEDTVNLDEAFMFQALKLADQAGNAGEVPVGAVLVSNLQIIGSGFNQPISGQDPTAHAEIMALRQAAQVQGNYRLPGSTLFVTIEPCLMCVGALIHARVGRLVFGAREPKAGAVLSHPCLATHPANHRFDVTEGVLEPFCGQRMSRFFAAKR